MTIEEMLRKADYDGDWVMVEIGKNRNRFDLHDLLNTNDPVLQEKVRVWNTSWSNLETPIITINYKQGR